MQQSADPFKPYAGNVSLLDKTPAKHLPPFLHQARDNIIDVDDEIQHPASPSRYLFVQARFMGSIGQLLPQGQKLVWKLLSSPPLKPGPGRGISLGDARGFSGSKSEARNTL